MTACYLDELKKHSGWLYDSDLLTILYNLNIWYILYFIENLFLIRRLLLMWAKVGSCEDNISSDRCGAYKTRLEFLMLFGV